MKRLKALTVKKPAKDQREKMVLLGLVELYLQTGKPVGSQTLQENGFEQLSSATIRNYFAKLEEDGYLKQPHSSGGRIPTSLAYKLYADHALPTASLEPKEREKLHKALFRETREVASYLHEAAEVISEGSRCAVFLSSPRFDQDFILDVKIIPIDQTRLICVLVTDFGLIHTEILYTDKKVSSFTAKRLEAYFRWKLTGLDKPELNGQEETLANRLYNEIMLRHIVEHNNFSSEDIYKTGFSRLLTYPDFNDAAALANGLSLFENERKLRELLSTSSSENTLRCWIGEDIPSISSCSVIAIPYRINQSVAGSIAILGPTRIPYRRLFGLLKAAADEISSSLTKSLYKFKITFRQPENELLETQPQLLEHHT